MNEPKTRPLASELVRIPLFTTRLVEFPRGPGDFGSVPTPPGGFTNAGNKTIRRDDFVYTKPDGVERVRLFDIAVTVNRWKATVNGNDMVWTGAQLAFSQYNHTQNAIGAHECSLTVTFLNAAGGPEGIVYSKLPILRDQCYLIGRCTLDEVYSGKDVFDLVTSIELDMNMTWEHEGAC